MQTHTYELIHAGRHLVLSKFKFSGFIFYIFALLHNVYFVKFIIRQNIRNGKAEFEVGVAHIRDVKSLNIEHFVR